MKKIIALSLALIISVMTLALAGCSKKDAPTGDDTKTTTAASDMSYVKEKGTLIVGITDYEPMNYKDSNGKWIGFDTELAEAYGKRLGVKVEFIEIDWGTKFTELKAKSIDCIWNGMTITDEARLNSSVSDPYITNSQVVVVPAADASKYTTVASLKELNFAVENGSAGATAATDNGLKSTAVSTQNNALLEVKSKACDGCIIDKTMADATIGQGSNYSNLAVSMTLTTEEFGISFRKNSDLCDDLNTFIKEYKASGDFDKLAEKYNVK